MRRTELVSRLGRRRFAASATAVIASVAVVGVGGLLGAGSASAARNKKLAGVIASASMVVAALVAFPPPAGAITGCPSGTVNHCYAIGRMGENWTGKFVPINAISGDLLVLCLGVNQYTDFVNYETWLDTNLNAYPVGTYWVEEGAKDGIGVTGADEGFRWFWADNRPGGGYFEHYEGAAALNQFTNVSFSWLSGTGNWNVYLGGDYEGESVNNGAWAGGSDTGIETTTASATFEGWTRWWQYADPSWNWHNVSTAGDGEAVYGPLNVNGYIYKASPGDDPVQIGQGSNACSPGTLNGEVPFPLARPSGHATSPASLRALALHASTVNGDSAPQGVQYVQTMSSKIAAFTGHRRGKDIPVYVIQMHGHFNGAYASVPPGHSRPSGTTMIIVLDARTGQVTDAGITHTAANLSALGRPVAISG
jgi:hypothetical protein